MRRAALQLGDRARTYYAAQRTEEAGVTVTRAPLTVSVGVTAGFVRMLLLIATPVVIAVVALLTDTDIGGGKWISALVLLVVVSVLTTLLWLSFRWMRRRRRRSRLAEAR
jgi:hypothetical protein